MTVNHQAAIQELRDMHNITMATLHEEHARTMRGTTPALISKPQCGTSTAKTDSPLPFCVLLNLCVDLRKAHEQQKSLLEEDFEKLRLSLQV